MSMFCYQCEQTSKNVACESVGVCGKTEETSALQDLLVHSAKGVACLAHALRQEGMKDREADVFVIEALFATVTNVNFDPERLEELLQRSQDLALRLNDQYTKACSDQGKEPTFSLPDKCRLADSREGLLEQAQMAGINQRKESLDDDITGLQELVLYGLKGTAAYADHALILGEENDDVYAFFHESLAFLAGNPTDIDVLTALALKVGEVNLTVMGMLDKANTDAYGHPEPTSVRVTPIKGKAILVSGHDLKDLHELLKQTEGKDINIYTHGEMLPCLAYPGLKEYPHLVGNYGGAWQDQKKEFDEFPGAILMTTNCIQKPKDSYHDRIFTSGLVAWPDVKHIANGDFTPVIEAALSAPGFTDDAEEKNITVGFARNAVLGVAGAVIDAVKAGQLRHFFLIGGCDGAKSGRNYYTEFAQKVPEDCAILTLACGKFRFNKLDFGDIGGIPRLLDIGQCNDAYSAIQIAVALAEAFECGVNDLPLSMILSWYEQKAVCILLTLLHLGIKNIRVGPSLPAFITPPVLQVLVDNFDLKPISTPDDDLAAILG